MRQGGEMFVATDRRGRPRLSGIHDARLTKLSLHSGRMLSFETVGEHHERRTFVLDALHLLNIAGRWEGVIVDSISIWQVADDFDETSDDDVSRVWRALLADHVHVGGEGAEVARLRRSHDRLSLVSLSCSYGGELQALCRDVLIDGRRVVAA